MSAPTKNQASINPVNNLLINLAAVVVWLVIAALLILGRINRDGRSGAVGYLFGLTVTWLLISPLIHQALHRKVQSAGETEPRRQLLMNVQFVLMFAASVVVTSLVFTFLHQQLLVVMK